MNILGLTLTEEQLAKLTYDLDIARAKVYKSWGFTIEQISTLIDRLISEEEINQ